MRHTPCDPLAQTRGLLVLCYPANFTNVSTPQDKIIEQLEAEILRLKTEINDAEAEADRLKKQYDQMYLLLRGIR